MSSLANYTNKDNEIALTLASAVATSGTVTVGYPLGAGLFNGAGNQYSKGDYILSNAQHVLILGQNKYVSPKDFTLTFNANASSITVTNKGAATWPAAATGLLQLNLNGQSTPQPGVNAPNISGITKQYEMGLDLGSPNAAAANNICASQAVATAKNLTINGTLAQTINGAAVGVFDCPRTMQFVSANAGDTTQTVAIQGYDIYDQKVAETITLNGTTIVTSKKALKAVTQMAISAATAGNVTVGTSTTLGLPLALIKAVQLIKEGQDGAVATAGTLVAADQSTPTATTGDVRGTYVPNAAPDGSKGYFLIVSIADPSDFGVPQFGF